MHDYDCVLHRIVMVSFIFIFVCLPSELIRSLRIGYGSDVDCAEDEDEDEDAENGGDMPTLKLKLPTERIQSDWHYVNPFAAIGEHSAPYKIVFEKRTHKKFGE